MSIFKLFTNKTLFWVMFVVIVGGWFLYALCDYYFLGIRIWDTGLHVQPVLHWVLYGEYIDKFLADGGVHPFVNHFRPLLLVLAPFLYLWQTMLVIHLAKVIAFASCPLIFLYFGKKFGLEKLMFAIPTLWLIHDVLITVMYAGNQSTTLSLPFIVLAFMLAMNKSYRLMWLPLLAVVFFKENLPLVWICLGMFIGVEQKKWKLGSLIITLGILSGLLIYFVIIPGVAAGTMQHSANAFQPFTLIGEKIQMLIRVYLTMGFFVFFRPQAILYTLPAYAVYLIAGKSVYPALFLNFHYHDFTTAILFCAGFFFLVKTKEGQTRFNIQLKGQRRYLKVCLVIMMLFYIAKTPYIRMIQKSAQYPLAFKIRQTAEQAKETIVKNNHIYVVGTIMDVFINLRYIHAFEFRDNNHIDPYIQQKPFTIIFPTHPKFSLLPTSFVSQYVGFLNQHHKKGLCSLTIYNKDQDEELIVVNYSEKLPVSEQKKLIALLDQYSER